MVLSTIVYWFGRLVVLFAFCWVAVCCWLSITAEGAALAAGALLLLISNLISACCRALVFGLPWDLRVLIAG